MHVRGCLVSALVLVAAAPASGPGPHAPGTARPAPTMLLTRHGPVAAVAEEVREQGVYLQQDGGSASGYETIADPPTLVRGTPAAQVARNELVQVLPQAVNSHGIQVVYDRVTVHHGVVDLELPVDRPAWRVRATGTYAARVTLHYTWRNDVEAGDGTATFWFKLHVPRRPARRPAAASTVLFFRTPSGNIGCVFSAGLAGAAAPVLRCDVRSGLRPRPRRPAACDLDYGDSVAVGRAGRASLVCHGDTVLDPRARVLGYGRTWSRGGISCASRATGLTCMNRSGHGFFLSRERWRIV